jgi:hypothetical protein
MTNFIYNTEPDAKELSLREKQCSKWVGIEYSSGENSWTKKFESTK